jgi:hypothetical protein
VNQRNIVEVDQATEVEDDIEKVIKMVRPSSNLLEEIGIPMEIDLLVKK